MRLCGTAKFPGPFWSMRGRGGAGVVRVRKFALGYDLCLRGAILPMGLLRTCMRYREMMVSFTRRDLRQRYVGSVIGWPWPFIQPIMTLAVYYVVFNVILDMRFPPALKQEIATALNKEPESSEVGIAFVIMLCVGLVPWMATAEYLMRSANVVVESGSLVKKMNFPAELLPVSVLGSYLINMMVLFAVFLLFTWTLTPYFSPLVWLFPVVVACHAFLLLGLGYLLATANVFVRDVAQLLPIFVNLIFFLTPIVYVREMLVDGDGNPRPFVEIFDWNPFSYLIELYRWTLVLPAEIRVKIKDEGGFEPLATSEVLWTLGAFGVFSFLVFLVGYRTFMANKHKFADEL
jgi:homopolymeric O-antigen transport system permease protein